MEKAVTLPNVEPAAEAVRNFTIKSSTNEVLPETNDLALAQHSDKVERFTFTIADGIIKGHDITDCNSVLIHFQNTSKDLSQRSIGIYSVTDLAVAGKTVTLSWLIGEEATRYAGSLIFSIHFARIDEDGKTAYNLPTLTFARVTVGDTVWNSETIEKDHPDIIAEFEARIAELEKQLAQGCDIPAVRYAPQVLSLEEQFQARKNVSVEASFYSTVREELAVTLWKEGAVPNDITSEVVWDLYDALMAKYPDRVQKNEFHNNDGTFTNYEYVISTGEYNTEGAYTEWYGDKDIKKPKYLILSGIHGFEEPAILSAYRFIRDVVEGHNVPTQFREGCAIHIMPVGNPYSLDNHIKYNENGVNINRNFDWDFGLRVQSDKKPYIGASGNSEKETQAIANWLRANKDAEMFFDCHNQTGAVNEIAWFIGLPDNDEYKRSKEIALRGVGGVVPFWRDTIGYFDGTVYPQSWKLDEGGLAIAYASEVLNVPSLAIEMSGYQNASQEEYNADRDAITPETVSAGAEIIGNVLIEFYEHLFVGEVSDDMNAIDGKLDEILFQVNSGFRIETGVYTVETDNASSTTIELPCKGLKILVFVSDAATREAILATTSGQWLIGFVGQTVAELPYSSKTYIKCGGYLSKMNDGKPENKTALIVDTDNGIKFSCNAIKAGNYNWTAYYWNE